MAGEGGENMTAVEETIKAEKEERIIGLEKEEES
jgi:hypothetical protein